ncbi:MAG TPA: hypothetical protein VJ783_32340 [Pirellulales bacterium]|nr:hypothetical protein [Pirellulales bacterium]
MNIVLGLSESADELAATLRTTQLGNFETFPFLALTARDDEPWSGVRRAMNAAETIRFTLKGMRKAVFQRWLKHGLHRSEPVLGQRGWTNRELYEILTVEHLRVKTTFYGELGEPIDEPGEWLDCP